MYFQNFHNATSLFNEYEIYGTTYEYIYTYIQTPLAFNTLMWGSFRLAPIIQRKSQFNSPTWGSLRLTPIKLGECSALWGKREKVVWSITRCFIALPPTCIHLTYNNSLIARSSPPPTVACKTTGEERLGKRLHMYRYQMSVFVKQYNLGMC